ncbi:MAG TPA: hypothetical protein EYN73_04595 [Chromatiaceae bacterium]|nr:hypothetical protein [Chromatiaceae bacterium]HIA08348.1 hypothetical protein [Chromatiaceae bacterium]HIN82454.1 hypothetical protein [Chromatiales bacterium]HIO13899.1 hypothetical protein [Chromatiales bacterium]HIO53841.1 hypothetical protein [Chromatiales bacterium]
MIFFQPVRRFIVPLVVVMLSSLTVGCSMGTMVVKGSLAIIDSGALAMNRETDLKLAEMAIPANFKMLEGLILESPQEPILRVNAMQALYGYAYGFVEPDDPVRAAALYRRCIAHGDAALQASGFSVDPDQVRDDELRSALAKMSSSAVPALFWTASCRAKYIDLNRDDPVPLAGLGVAAAIMERVLELDPEYFYGGPHLFFGIYYGARPRFFGGDLQLAEKHFAAVRAVTNDRLLIVDVLEAQYLSRQQLNQERFHVLLTRVIDAPDNLQPDMALSNAIAKQLAVRLLRHEQEWF